MKIRTKLWLFMLISFLGSLILFFVFTLASGKIWNKGYDLNKLTAVSQEILDTVKRENAAFDKERIRPILDEVHARHPVLRLEWAASDGAILYDTSGENRIYDFRQLADRLVNMPENLWSEDNPITLAYSANHNGQAYYLLISLPSEAMKQGQIYFFMRTFNVLFTFILPVLLFFLVPYLLSLLFFSSMNRRIRRLNTALNQVSIRSGVVEVQDKSGDEIGQLARHYNSMAHRVRSQADQIEQLENRRRLLLSNLSHDLRTPLTMILGYAETIRAGLYKDETELQTNAKIILQRSRYMDKLLDQLLDITRQDADTFELHLAPHNVSEMMRKIVADYLLLLDGQGFTVDADIPDQDIEAMIDASLIERAIRNLLDNAIRYGHEGRYLALGLVERENEVSITVKDKGRGISPKDRERIFERFYRVDGGRKGEGLGIGLSIVKEIAESHGGYVQLTSKPYEETVFEINLPKK